MQVRVAREFKGEPARLIFVEGRYARIFLDQRLQAVIFGVDAEGDRVAFEDASCARQQAKHGLSTIKRRKPKEGFLRDLYTRPSSARKQEVISRPAVSRLSQSDTSVSDIRHKLLDFLLERRRQWQERQARRATIVPIEIHCIL